MNPLYIDAPAISLSLDNHSLVVRNQKTSQEVERFKPREIPYDSIVIQRSSGYISLAAINWLVLHSVSVTILNWRGNILAQILPEEPISNELKVAQYSTYLNQSKRLGIARTIVGTKERRQQELLSGLSKNYPVQAPKIPYLPRPQSMIYIRNHEARYAEKYFREIEKVCRQLGFEFRGRKSMDHNQKAPTSSTP